MTEYNTTTKTVDLYRKIEGGTLLVDNVDPSNSSLWCVVANVEGKWFLVYLTQGDVDRAEGEDTLDDLRKRVRNTHVPASSVEMFVDLPQ